MEGKRFVGLFDSSIKTEEDLVKFKLQKEEGDKAAAAREAANEKDSSLQTQPTDKSHLQLRRTASHEPMVTDSIKAVNKEEAKMTAENQARKEAVSDYADSYREELADVCAASEEIFTPAQNGKLKESAERLYKEMREFEQSEGTCGPDQDAWDSFAVLHERNVRNVRNILAVKEISEATGRESKASEEAAGEAVQSIEESIVFISRRGYAVNFFDVDAWGKTAEIAKDRLAKGEKVYIEGRLDNDIYEQSGQKRSRTKIIAEYIEYSATAYEDDEQEAAKSQREETPIAIDGHASLRNI